MNTKNTLLSLMAFLFSFSSIFGQAVAITPVRTDLSGFISWTDTSVGGTTYLQLLSATSKTIAPTMDFVAYTAPTLDFKLRTFGGTSGSSNVVTVSISTNNGLTYSSLGTRTATGTLLTAVTQFDLSAYLSSQIRIKFESLGATGTIGVGIDDIAINGVPGCNAPLTQATFGTTIAASTSLTQVITAGSGAGRLVLINSTNSFTDPTNGTAYTANTVYAGNGQQVVYSGAAGTSVAVSNLSNTTTYYFAIYEYNCSGSTIVYNKTENTTSGTTTLAGCTTGTQYPTTTYAPLNNGTSETITGNTWAGEYSVIDIPSTGNVYRFSSSASADFITITNSTGSTIYASGVTPLTWTSTVAATIRYYIHLNASCTTSSVARTRYIQTISTACGSPSSPLAINISSNSASVSWTALVTAPSSGYEVYYAVASTAPTNSTAGFLTASNLYFIDSLTSNTTYYYWVRSKCGTAISPWVAGGTFKTLTTLACNSATYGLYPTTTFTPTYSGVEEQIATDCKTSQYTNVNILASKQYVFKSSYLTDYITITNEAGTVVYASGLTPLTWASGTNTGVARYYFHSNSSCSSGAVLRVKSIISTTLLSCGAPTGLTVAHITSNSAYVQVTAPSPSLTVSQYYLYINTTGFAPISTTQPTASSTTTSLFINALQANTTYYYWVNASCSSSSSDWVAGGTFTSLAAISSACNGASYGLFPTTIFTPACTGNLELISSSRPASQFSYITISPDKTYTFQSDTGTDYLTITNEAGTTLITKGSSPLTWNSGTTSGTFRYYLHSQVACGTSTTGRSKYVQCSSYCNPPSNFSISNIGSQTVTLSWLSSASGYQTFFSTENTEPTDATGFFNSTTVNSFTAYGLAPSTTYYSWIRSVCSFGNGSWIMAGSFTTLAGGCTTGTLFPTATFTPAYTGIAETITTQAYAGEYSNIAIQTGKNYMFSSSISTDYITITDATGSTVYAYGTSPVMWSSGTNSGTIRFFIHTNVFCQTQNANRTRYLFATTPCLTTAPTVSAQSFCDGATVGNLVATGTNIKWYNVPWAGTALTSTTALTTGIYYVTQTVGCESSRLDVSITVNPNTTTSFTPIADICAGANLDALPTTSNNGFTGTWSPAVNNLQTTTYTFTPTAGLCATTTTMTITVNPNSTPTFTQIAPINSGGSLNALPNISNNGITGTWSPALNNTATATYTFTPTAGICTNISLLNIVVNSVAPNISYSAGAQAFTVGSSISPLTPNNSGGAVPNAIYQNVSTVAGVAGSAAATDGTGTAARFNWPNGLALDTTGNLFVADRDNNTIRKITPAGAVSTFAGSVTSGATDGTGTAASFSSPNSVSVDASGNVYVADYFNNKIRKITPNAVVSTLVDSAAGLNRPAGVAVDASGNIYITDSYNFKIKKVTAAGILSTLAGSGAFTSTNGTGTSATFKTPFGIAVDSLSNVYVAERDGNKIRKITPAGVVTTVAGSGTAGSVEGIGINASFSDPMGVATDVWGNLYVGDRANNKIRKITTAGVVSTLAGGTTGSTDGIGTNASFSGPVGLAVDTMGNVYVSEIYNNTIRKISQQGYSVTPSLPAGLSLDGTGTITGTPTVSSPLTTYMITAYNTGGSSATNISFAVCTSKTIPTFTQVASIVIGASLSALPTTSNNGFTGTWSPALNNTTTTTYTFTPTAGLCATIATMTIYVGNPPVISYLNNTQTYNVGTAISAISPNNTGGAVPAIVFGQTSTLAGSGSDGAVNGSGATASFSRPTGVALDAAGNTYVADQYNHKIRKITAAGVVSNFAGSGTVGSADGTGTAASFNLPFGLTVDSSGNVYVADSGNNKIRKITPSGVVSTLAGSGAQGATDGNGTSASFYFPTGVKLDASGNLLVADFNNHKIRKISPSGVTSTFAGSGSVGSTDGTGVTASFNNPEGIDIDASGNIYIADKSNQKIRKITPLGVVSTFAGSGAIGTADGASNVASFNYPQGVAVDRLGAVYVADGSNNLIRKITTSGVVSTLAGSGIDGSDNLAGTSSRFSLPINLTVDSALNVYVADYYNNKIRKIAQPNGGYSISPGLPSGLNFNSTTGEISGTPYSASTTRNYTVTGYNEIGSGSTTLSITSIPNILLTGAGVGGWLEAGIVALTSTDGITFSKSGVEILGSGGASSEVKFTEGTWSSALGNSSSTVGSGFPTGTASVSGSNIAAIPGFWNVSYNYQTKAYSFTPSSSPNPIIKLSGSAIGSTDVTLSTTDGISYYKESITFTSGLASFVQDGTTNQWSSAAFPQGTGTLSGTLISIPSGTYNVSYNYNTKVYDFQPIVFSVIGDFNNWASDVDMFTTDNVSFTLTNQVFAANTLLKFRDNHSWNYGFGSSSPYTGGVATLGGGNISVPAGNYSISFNRSTLAFSIIATPTPPTTSSQTFCDDATVVNLLASGTGLKWYASTTGGSPLVSNTLLATGTYYVSQTVNGVESTRTAASITITPKTTPEFAQVAPICSGASLAALSTTSNNSITGTWSPTLNNAATTTYTFTPTAGLCATSTTMTITVNPNITPEFAQVAPICSGASLSALPTTSNNGFTGTWSPALNNTATTTYTFTPNTGLCATSTTMTITVNPNVTPEFAQVAPICAGGFLAALPTISNNSISGTWSPALDNSATTTYIFTPTVGLCATSTTMTITVNTNITPEFAQVAPICSGGFLVALPTTSDLGISGSWSPALDNSTTTTYTFTPESSQCATTATMTITINPNVTPEFTQVAPICAGGFLAALPTTSNNGLTGTWSPALNNTATTTYTFTPTVGLCATSTTMTITVNPNVTPTFSQVAPICAGASLAVLPTTSNNGLTGTWSPAINNALTTTYTFMPTAGLCATSTTMTITVNPNVTPEFAQVAPICAGGFLAALPTISNNSISGTWSPALDNSATTTYIFTPTVGLCVTSTTMKITVNPNVTPEFTQVAPICAGASLSALPTTSDLGISGTWSPALNNAATTTYTFTPTAGLCATSTTMTITVNPNVAPEFAQVAPICSGANLAALLTTSNNGLTGTWSPIIDNTATTTYTFTPESSQCATTATMTITVNPNVTPEFTQVAPICAGGFLAALPTTLNNGLTGTWSPAINNALTTTYTFMPTAGLCATTATMTITVNPTSVAGTAAAVATICSGSSTSVSLSGNTGTIQWQKSDAVNTAWSVINGATSIILNADAMTATTYFRAVVTSGVCSSAISNSVAVSVITTPAPTVAAQTIPSTATVANLVATGTNLKWYTTASGGNALATTTVLVQSNYYVSQTLNGCESTVRALSAVTLYVIPVSKVITSQCGSTLTSIDANINAEVVTGYQAYRFEVTNGTTVNTIELNKYNFSLTQTPGIVYNTTYSVRVAVKMGNVWGAYGAPCSITTPLNASVSIVPVLATGTCGSTLLSVTQSIYAETVSGATSYRFKVNDLQVIETSNRYFSLNSITGGALFGTAYTIAVSCFVNGTWTSYGAACTVTTPGVAVPGTQMVLCGQTVTVLRQSIYAIQVGGATKYRFRVNGNQVIETANRYFNLTQVGAVLGTSYSIEVACLMSGVSWTPYGTACIIYTPSPTARELETTTASVFNVNASPNPFNTAFKLNVSEPTEETIFVSVYDMMGKQVENLELVASELKNVAIGQNYAAGIYNIIVSQGANIKTVRLIKK